MNLFLKKFFSVCLVLALAVAVGRQARRAIKQAQAKRLIAEAAEYFARKDFQDASRCLRAGLQDNPSSFQATTLTADLLEVTGSPAAINWRVRASQLQPANINARFDWAQTAVKLGDLKSAEDALSGLDEEAKSTARYHKIAGALAWSHGNAEQAEEHYRQALRLEPANPSNFVNLGTIGLASTNENTAATARLELQALAATNGPYALEALRDLSQEASRRKNISEALTYSLRIATNSGASFGDKLDCLNLLTAEQNTNARSWLSLLEQQATNSSVEVLALGRWLIRTGGATNALSWFMSLPGSLQTNQPVALVIADCQVATKNWTGLLATVAQRDWGESETMRLALESLACRSLGNDDAAQTLWKRARRQSARRLDRLYCLAQVAGSWGWVSERKEILVEMVGEFPREKWAVDLLVSQLCDAGETGELEQVLYRLSAADPANVRLKTSLARLGLLRKSQLPNAHRLAKEAFDAAPDDPLVMSTYAYSLLLQGQQDEAVRVLNDLAPQALQIPWVATCYGLIEAQSGNKQAAREPLKRAQAAKLLPEEMELVRIGKAAAN